MLQTALRRAAASQRASVSTFQCVQADKGEPKVDKDTQGRPQEVPEKQGANIPSGKPEKGAKKEHMAPPEEGEQHSKTPQYKPSLDNKPQDKG